MKWTVFLCCTRTLPHGLSMWFARRVWRIYDAQARKFHRNNIVTGFFHNYVDRLFLLCVLRAQFGGYFVGKDIPQERFKLILLRGAQDAKDLRLLHNLERSKEHQALNLLLNRYLAYSVVGKAFGFFFFRS